MSAIYRFGFEWGRVPSGVTIDQGAIEAFSLPVESRWGNYALYGDNPQVTMALDNLTGVFGSFWVASYDQASTVSGHGSDDFFVKFGEIAVRFSGTQLLITKSGSTVAATNMATTLKRGVFYQVRFRIVLSSTAAEAYASLDTTEASWTGSTSDDVQTQVQIGGFAVKSRIDDVALNNNAGSLDLDIPNPVICYPGSFTGNGDTQSFYGTGSFITRTEGYVSPQCGAYCPTNGKIYVTDGDTVKVVDPDSNEIVKVINLATGAGAIGIVFAQSTGKLYTANTSNGTVSVIDPTDDSVTVIAAVGTGPKYLCYLPTFDRIYVSCESSNVLAVIKLSDHTLLAPIGGFSSPRQMTYVPTVDRLYVANGGGNNVVVVNPNTNLVVTSITGITGATDVVYCGGTFNKIVAVGTATTAVQINPQTNAIEGSTVTVQASQKNLFFIPGGFYVYAVGQVGITRISLSNWTSGTLTGFSNLRSGMYCPSTDRVYVFETAGQSLLVNPQVNSLASANSILEFARGGSSYGLKTGTYDAVSMFNVVDANGIESNMCEGTNLWFDHKLTDLGSTKLQVGLKDAGGIRVLKTADLSAVTETTSISSFYLANGSKMTVSQGNAIQTYAKYVAE